LIFSQLSDVVGSQISWRAFWSAVNIGLGE